MPVDSLPIKDPEQEHPIPDAWRPTFRSIVSCLVAGDYCFTTGIEGVPPLTKADGENFRHAIEDYGDATLVELPDETWKSSVSMWHDGDSWDTLVDLFTAEEGRSDLVVQTRVTDTSDGLRFDVYLIYVP